MELAVVNAYNISLFVHITAAVVGLGATFALSILFPLAMSFDVRNLPFAHRLSLVIGKYFATPALVLILLTGIYQTLDGDWGFGDFWISATILIVIVLAGMTGAYFIPTDRRLGAMVERELAAAGEGEVTLSEEYQQGARVAGIMGSVAGVLVIIAVFLMVTKPGA